LLAVINGEISRDRLEELVATIPTLRRLSIQRIDEANRAFEEKVVRLTDRRSYLIDQRARQSDSRPIGPIRVLTGTYGANCGQGEGNKTTHLGDACNGKTECSYVIDYRVIGDPADGCAKNYIAKWVCGNDPRVRSEEVRPEAGRGSTVTLSCVPKPL